MTMTFEKFQEMIEPILNNVPKNKGEAETYVKNVYEPIIGFPRRVSLSKYYPYTAALHWMQVKDGIAYLHHDNEIYRFNYNIDRGMKDYGLSEDDLWYGKWQLVTKEADNVVKIGEKGFRLELQDGLDLGEITFTEVEFSRSPSI